MKLFLKLFVVIAIPFGTFQGLLVGMREGADAGVRSGILQGLIFGSLMALILGWLQRRQAYRIAGQDLGPHQELTVELLAGSSTAVFERALKAVKDFGAKIKNSDVKGGTITAKVPSSWKSFGEILTLKISHVEDAKYEVQIVSRPRFRSPIIDYVKRRENIENVSTRFVNR